MSMIMSMIMIKLVDPSECLTALCGYDEEHEHGFGCTTDCPCGEGGHNSDGSEA